MSDAKDRVFEYDIFISYASEDLGWVQEHLYFPLLTCRKKDDGKIPRIFFDKTGLPLGANFVNALIKAVRQSRRLIAVVSKNYLSPQKAGWTKGELNVAQVGDPWGEQGKILPVVIDQAAKPEFIEICPLIQTLDVQERPDWFESLTSVLELKAGSGVREVRFQADIPNAVVNNTLPPVRVTLWSESDPVTEEEIVDVTASAGGLQGTLKQRTAGGAAAFSDLSFREPSTGVRITAKAPGYRPAESNVISVQEPQAPAKEPPTQEFVTIPLGPSPEATQVVFFETGKAVAVIDAGSARVFAVNGRKLGELKLHARTPLVRTGGPLLVLADGEGRLYLLRDTGACREVALRPAEEVYGIPGDCAISGDAVLAGLWNGDVFRISAESGENGPAFHHPGGIQALAANGTAVYLCDFLGNCVIYENGRQVFTFPIERSILGMKIFQDKLVVIGEKRPYQVSLRERTLTPWHSNLSAVVYVLATPHSLLALDESGHGAFLDEELIARLRFHTTAGARPVSFATRGLDTYVSFGYPNGACALLKNEQIVYTQTTGLLSFDPCLGTVAAGTSAGIQLREGAWLLDQLREK